MSDVQDKIAWLLGRKPSKRAVKPKEQSNLAKIREEMGFTVEEMRDDPEVARVVKRAYYARRAKKQYEETRGIGELPEVQHPRRRKSCEKSLKLFIEKYFKTADKFNLPWADFHLEVMERIEESVLHGGLIAMALPRGSGKTSIVERAILWAMLYGHRRYVVCLGDGKSAADEIMDCVKTEIEANDKLYEDFPEVCFPVRALGGIPQRAAGQFFHGKPTNMSWGSTGEIILPTIDGSVSSGSILKTAGINSRIRGMKHTTADGKELRPDFVFLDDISNDRSASSPSQNDKRLKVINGTVLGLAGAGTKIAGVLAATVIKSGDVADTLLDREHCPEWRGVRYALLPSLPSDKELWDRYKDLWAEGQRCGEGIREATQFYSDHRQAMDEGAVASWEARYEPDEVSAIQHAMDKMFQSRETFWSEYQNQPVSDDEDMERIVIKPADITKKISGISRGMVPADTIHLVCSIDVQKHVLPYVVTAFASNGSAYVVDYGTWPHQPSPDWTLDNITNSYLKPGMGLEGALTEALDGMTSDLLGRTWIGEDGAEHHIERCLVDAAWGVSTNTVMTFCSRSAYASILMPSLGRGLGADKKPYSEYRREVGKRFGDFWAVVKHRSGVRVIEIDTNFSKSLLRQRILTPLGDKASWAVWGAQHDNKTVIYHANFASQMSSEFAIPTTGRQRTVDVWSLRPGRDNHFWDCASNCYSAASMLGMTLPELTGIEGKAGNKKEKRKCHLPGVRK